MERSYEKITRNDLKKLLQLSKSDIENFFNRNPRYIKPYYSKEVLIALGQGAALHYIDQKNGVKDFDVWYFFPKKSISLPYRRRGKVDFGKSKFGRHPDDYDSIGRRIDVLMRSDPAFNKDDPTTCIRRYLSNKTTKTAQLLSEKAMVGLWPEEVFGKILWPVK